MPPPVARRSDDGQVHRPLASSKSRNSSKAPRRAFAVAMAAALVWAVGVQLLELPAGIAARSLLGGKTLHPQLRLCLYLEGELARAAGELWLAARTAGAR